MHVISDADIGIAVSFDPAIYPQLQQVRRRFQVYELWPGSLNPTECTDEGFQVQKMVVTVGPGYSEYPYKSGDFNLVAMADDRLERYTLHLEFDSVPQDPSEPYHEGLLKVRLLPRESLSSIDERS